MGNVMKSRRDRKFTTNFRRLSVAIRVKILLYIGDPNVYILLPRLFVDHSGLIHALDATGKFGEYIGVWTVLCTKFGIDMTKISSVKPVVGCGRITRHMSDRYSLRALLPYMDSQDILTYVATRFRLVPHVASGHFISADFGDADGPLDTMISLCVDQFNIDVIIITINGEIRETITRPVGVMKNICEYIKQEIGRLASSGSMSSSTSAFTMVDLDTHEVTLGTRKTRSAVDLRRTAVNKAESFYYISPQISSPLSDVVEM